mmetsp:Transcript_12845/g.24113  ORF Transcript_12845/g.24113 Transcript_12845/m.24113 type:complete len:195 (+) Transcript_12845:474-1058(+)
MNSKNPNGVALSDAYSANSILELTLSPNDEVVQGLVYCTDEISNSIVLKKSLNYTTLASEIRVINASCVKTKKIIAARAPDSRTDGVTGEVQEVAIALPNVTKKSIEEREKRAIMLAQESLKHINQKASTEGQIVFERLLKACNEVKWNGESIIVLNNIRVDPPYKGENCKLLSSSGGVMHEGSLERVKRIVGA